MKEQKEHVVSPWIYVGVLIALMLLLLLTLAFAFIDVDHAAEHAHLGSGWNTAIAITIAVIKGLLIVLFFMHIRYSSRLAWAFASAGFVWLLIMLSLTMTDYFTRNHPPGNDPKGEPTYITAPVSPPHGTPQIDSFPGQNGAYH